MGEPSFILVTGAAGFVGSYVSRLLRMSKLNVRTHSRTAIAGIDYAGDLSDPSAVQALPLDNVRAVIHCAAAIPSRSVTFERDNTQGTKVLADALADAPALRLIVHVSSISVYSRPPPGPWRIHEQAAVVDPADERTDSYARSKRKAEIALDSVAAQRTDVVTYQLRASSIYGPGMVDTTLLPALAKRAQNNEPMVIRGPRTYRQNFVHVQDVAALAVAVANQDHHSPGQIVNAISDDTYGLFELAALIKSKLKSTSEIVDETDQQPIPIPSFENHQAKRWLPHFCVLRDHLEGVVA